MKLLVDIGNSRIKWCRQRRTGSLGGMHAAGYTKSILRTCLDDEWGNLKNRPEQIWVASVAGGSVDIQVIRWTRAHWGMTPHFARVTRLAGGVRNAYAAINQLGVDRWLALIATWRKYGTAACIVSCGTAVTIDGLDGRGRHMGGLILPGISLMQQSLYRSTGNIPLIRQERLLPGLANNTSRGVSSGCSLAVVALIDHAVAMIRKKAGGNIRCVISGGGAGAIMPLLRAGFSYEPRLVLEGLAVLGGNT